MGLVGYVWLDTPLAQLAAWIGPLGLTGLTFFVVALPFSVNNGYKVLSIFTIISLALTSSLFFPVWKIYEKSFFRKKWLD